MPPTLDPAIASVDQLGEPVVIGLVLTVGYVATCVAWPLAACRWCRGRGKFRSPSGRAWRKCGHCRGSGSRIRLGRRLWEHLRRTHKRSKK